jgi:hypothetical protein
VLDCVKYVGWLVPVKLGRVRSICLSVGFGGLVELGWIGPGKTVIRSS